MSQVTDLISKLQTKLVPQTEKARDIDATYKFDLTGEDGGQWIVNLKDAVGITQGDGPADCTLQLPAKDFVDLFEGRVNGQQLFFSGRLRIDGDMGLALKLQRLTELLK